LKAIIHTTYGAPAWLSFQEVKKPVPKANEVCIKIHAATVTSGDCEVRRFDIPMLFWLPLRLIMGFFKPRNKILGGELAGVIESIGGNVTRFKQGDQVFAATMMRLGAYAEYICLPETYPIAIKPDSVSFEKAATIPTGGLNGLHFLRKGQVKKGDEILINGAGGSIGTYAVQIAKSLGAYVTAVDSTSKLDLLRSLGADAVIDYTKQDFVMNGKKYDVIIDVVGKRFDTKSFQSLKKGGRYVMGNPRLPGMIKGLWSSLTSDYKVYFQLAPYKTEDLIYLSELVAKGNVKAVIAKNYPLAQIAEAHTFVESGEKIGNVVINVAD
jgi:NADPH:quinone reductase-like Zn-dependent oxidoreductase